ncbi:hypothetical protein [Nostoc sp. DSM 114167]|uniref:hypothetical protein n=1 Tax=Nostoc sp. DSM 114167 TaxID=3439050 RepID=UPI0040466F68
MSEGAIATSPRLSKKTDSALFGIFMLRSLLKTIDFIKERRRQRAGAKLPGC